PSIRYSMQPKHCASVSACATTGRPPLSLSISPRVRYHRGMATERDFAWTDPAARKILKIIVEAVAAEREACAQIAQQWMSRTADDDLDVAQEIAFRIRARGAE